MAANTMFIPNTMPAQDPLRIESTVIIKRPIENVFHFYQDFKNLPPFLGDVMVIEPTGPATSKEVAVNLNRLKQYLETGTVTDTSYSVPGKFSNQN